RCCANIGRGPLGPVYFAQLSLLATWTRLAPGRRQCAIKLVKLLFTTQGAQDEWSSTRSRTVGLDAAWPRAGPARKPIRPDPLRSSCLSRPAVRLMAWRVSVPNGWAPCLANPL